MIWTNFFTGILPVAGGFFALVMTIGSIIAFRQSYSKQVIAMKNEMISTLQAEITALKKEQERQKRQIVTMRYAFKEQGIRIKINGEFITLTNTYTGRKKILPIQEEIQQIEREDTRDDDKEEENTGNLF